LIRQQFKAQDAIGKVSDRLGIQTDKLSELQYAASLSGVENRKLELGLQRMTRRIAEAAKGTGEAKAAIKELGFDAKRLAGLSPDQAFAEIADALQGVQTQSDRVRLAFKLFDSEGVSLIQMMSGGSKGLKEMQEEAKRLGLTLDRIETAKIEMANNAITKLKGAFEGLTKQLAAQLAPFISELAEQFSAWADSGWSASLRISTAFAFVQSVVGGIVDLPRKFSIALKQMEIAAFSAISKPGGIVDELRKAFSFSDPGASDRGGAVDLVSNELSGFMQQYGEFADSATDKTQQFDAALATLNDELEELKNAPSGFERVEEAVQSILDKWQELAEKVTGGTGAKSPILNSLQQAAAATKMALSPALVRGSDAAVRAEYRFQNRAFEQGAQQLQELEAQTVLLRRIRTEARQAPRLVAVGIS